MAFKENNLTEGNVARQLVRYALPLAATNLLQSVYGITDIIIAGHFIGGNGISAITNSSQIMFVLTSIATGLAIGGNILISSYYGGGREEDRRQASGTLFSLFVLLGLAFWVALGIFSEQILTIMKAPSLEEATVYLNICAKGLIFIFGYNALTAILRAMGNTRTALVFIMLSGGTNIVLDLVFVAALNHGVAGAARATIISQALAFACALIYVLKNREVIGFGRRYLRIARDKCKEIFRLGLPLCLQHTIAGLSWLTVLFLINRYGVDVSAGSGVSNKVKELLQLLIGSNTAAAATMIAQNLGAGKTERAERVMLICLKMTVIISLATITLVQLFAPAMVSIFTDEDSVRQWAAFALRIEIFGQLGYAGFLSFNTLPTGSGHTMFVMFNSFVNCVIVRIVLAVVLERFMGITGVFIGCAIAPYSSVPIGFAFYKSKRWQRDATVRSA